MIVCFKLMAGHPDVVETLYPKPQLSVQWWRSVFAIHMNSLKNYVTAQQVSKRD